MTTQVRPILLSADTPCDIGPVLQARYGVSLFPLHILLGDQSFTDGKDITPEELYQAWRERHLLPQTSAINPEEYAAYFTPYLDQGYDVLHISLGSGLSCSYQNACIAAERWPDHVFVIDSRSLSTGFGLLVCEAGERIARGVPIAQIHTEIAALTDKTRASFMVDTLEFLHASGRCSGLAHLSAEMFKIKPTILVRNDLAGSMAVGKKYMGKLDHTLIKYVEDTLSGRDDIVLDRCFVTFSTIDPDLEARVVARVKELQPFKEVFITHASCTISAHCGPNTLGVLFMTK